MALAPPVAVVPNVPAGQNEVSEQQLRETLAGDVQRAVKLGESPNVGMWTPRLPFVPPQRAPVPYNRGYATIMMLPLPDLPRCRLGGFCQGHLLATVLPSPRGGYTLPKYVAQDGRGFADLCVVCLQLAATVARPWGFGDWPRFRITAFAYGDESLKYV
jgi:hypothetical protein